MGEEPRDEGSGAPAAAGPAPLAVGEVALPPHPPPEPAPGSLSAYAKVPKLPPHVLTLKELKIITGLSKAHTPPAAAETPKLKRKKANKADAAALDAAAPAAADAAAGTLKLKRKKAKKTDAAAPDAAAHAAADASKGQGSGAPPQPAPKAAAPPPPPATTAPVPAESKREQLKRKVQEAKALPPWHPHPKPAAPTGKSSGASTCVRRVLVRERECREEDVEDDVYSMMFTQEDVE